MNNISRSLVGTMVIMMLVVVATANTTTQIPILVTKLPCSQSPTLVYIGQNLSCGGFTVQLSDLSYPNANGASAAVVGVYKNGWLVTSMSVPPSQISRAGNTDLFVYVQQTAIGLYASERWAKIQLFIASQATQLQNTVMGNSQRCGSWTVTLEDLSYPNANGVSAANLQVSLGNGRLVKQQIIVYPQNLTQVDMFGQVLHVYVNQTFSGLYPAQRWAQMQLFC